MQSRAQKFLIGFLVLCLLAFCGKVYGQEESGNHLCNELEAAGFKIVDTGVVYGVPFVKIKIPLGFSITSLCERIPSLNRQFFLSRSRIAFFNALNPNYVKTATPEPWSIEATTLKIPLDFRAVPEIFPEFDQTLANYKQYLLVDIGKHFLALYERGELRRVFPISPGVPGKRTPLMEFHVLDKYKNYYSRTFDYAWMPWALRVQGPYFIHGGVLPGKPDSHGCIRIPIHDAKQLFHLVNMGTPGRIIDTTKVPEESYPAFCRSVQQVPWRYRNLPD